MGRNAKQNIAFFEDKCYVLSNESGNWPYKKSTSCAKPLSNSYLFLRKILPTINTMYPTWKWRSSYRIPFFWNTIALVKTWWWRSNPKCWSRGRWIWKWVSFPKAAEAFPKWSQSHPTSHHLRLFPCWRIMTTTKKPLVRWSWHNSFLLFVAKNAEKKAWNKRHWKKLPPVSSRSFITLEALWAAGLITSFSRTFPWKLERPNKKYPKQCRDGILQFLNHSVWFCWTLNFKKKGTLIEFLSLLVQKNATLPNHLAESASFSTDEKAFLGITALFHASTISPFLKLVMGGDVWLVTISCYIYNHVYNHV